MPRILAFVLLVSAATAAVAEAPARDLFLTVDQSMDMERVSDPQISPDGKRIVYTRGWVDKSKDRWESALWIVDADGRRNRFLVKGAQARWSPDGTRIAYVAAGEPSGRQIFVRWMDTEGATSQVTRVEENPRSLRWSPDGTRIAFVMLAPSEPDWKVELPQPPEGAEWTEPPRIVDRMHFRQDRRGFLEDGFHHLFVVPSTAGTPRQLTRGKWHVGARPLGLDFGAGIDWSPDGREIFFDAHTVADADVRYRESHLYAVELASREIRQITEQKGPWAGPVVSPDGKTLAFVGFPWTPQTYRAQELYLIGTDGKNQRSISGSLDRDPQQLHWMPDGRGVLFTVDDRGSRHLYRASTSAEPTRLTSGVQQFDLGSVSREGVAVGIVRDPHEPGDVVRVRIDASAAPRRLTRVHEDVLSGLTLGEVEQVWYRSGDGTRIQGWLVKPPRFDPAGKYPLILHIHGGPHAMYRASFNYSFQNFATHGYLVLYTNPRGSTGYGTEFGNAIDNAYPGVDYDDLMAGVDEIVGRGYVDVERMYVTGVSGGGVLSSWTIAHTDRFAAAAVRAPVTNWISFAGTTDITAWGYFRFREEFWEQPERWLRHSPLMHVERVDTPTLLMTGELDLRTPMGQTEEYYQALKKLGVPTVMLRFHDEYHGTSSRPSNFIRTQLYLIDWFGRHRRPAGTD